MSPHSLHLRLVGGRAEAGSPSVPIDPIAVLEVDHVLKLELCDALERLADGLPNETDMALAKVAVTVLRRGLPEHIELEGRHLFPLLKRRLSGDEIFRPVLEQLEFEHEHDDAFAIEISEELERLAEAGKARNAEMLGYMLRGFFVSLRRHVCWENATVLPLARRKLTENDLDELREAIVARSLRHAVGRSMDAFIGVRTKPAD
ncbi:MAG: hemerythrin domain-containing protein [Alphaproteobacteria bacterium]|nr:hemerythrin domain-containing protein [Alphaproteobacteria bacterium]